MPEVLPVLNLAVLRQSPLQTDPFDHLITSNLIYEERKSEILLDAPDIRQTGSKPLNMLQYGPMFQQLIHELMGREFECEVSAKLALDLSRYERMISVRGRTGQSDGRIHTDSKDKIATVLLYLNDDWKSSAGRLRLLRTRSLDDYAAEISPNFGNLLLFRRCDYSYHGHQPFEGKRMAVQLNWVKSNRYKTIEQARHLISSWFKKSLGN